MNMYEFIFLPSQAVWWETRMLLMNMSQKTGQKQCKIITYFVLNYAFWFPKLLFLVKHETKEQNFTNPVRIPVFVYSAVLSVCKSACTFECPCRSYCACQVPVRVKFSAFERLCVSAFQSMSLSDCYRSHWSYCLYFCNKKMRSVPIGQGKTGFLNYLQ